MQTRKHGGCYNEDKISIVDLVAVYINIQDCGALKGGQVTIADCKWLAIDLVN